MLKFSRKWSDDSPPRTRALKAALFGV